MKPVSACPHLAASIWLLKVWKALAIPSAVPPARVAAPSQAASSGVDMLRLVAIRPSAESPRRMSENISLRPRPAVNAANRPMTSFLTLTIPSAMRLAAMSMFFATMSLEIDICRRPSTACFWPVVNLDASSPRLTTRLSISVGIFYPACFLAARSFAIC